jgi:hypothetical protein
MAQLNEQPAQDVSPPPAQDPAGDRAGETEAPLTASPPGRPRGIREWAGRLLRWGLVAILRLLLSLVILWPVLAIYYSNLPWRWARGALAAGFLAFAVWALWVTPRPGMRWALAGVCALVVVWFASIRPSHDRPWRPEVAVMPRVAIDGDRVRITGYRNFDYRTRDDFTVRYEEREVSLSRISGVDLFISYWSKGPVAHTFLSFRFDDDDAPPVCVSIETKPEVGEGFAPVASMFKQFELIYVVGDERDIVRVRTNYRNEHVFLYPIRTTPQGARRLFLVYADRINQLAERPEFYHLLKNSCTINIVRYANAAGREGRFDIRHLLNGWVDRYLYRAGHVDTSLPFEELRRRSQITDAAREAGDAGDFSKRIRAGLPGER